jgi:16S rRNA (guanine527-N7)-methyltransferase
MIIGSKIWQLQLRHGASFFGVDLDDLTLQSFTRYAKELLIWNKKINLTSITQPHEILEKHFIDSLAVYPYLLPHRSLLEMGSGAGFPGIVLKIVLPSLKATLIDASGRKINFIKHVIRTLGIKDIQAQDIRAEDLQQRKMHHENFEVVICRAFSALDTFLDMALPLLTRDGIALAMKGKFPYSEIKSIGAVGSNPQYISRNNYHLKMDAYTYQLPFSFSQRSLIRFTLLGHDTL